MKMEEVTKTIEAMARDINQTGMLDSYSRSEVVAKELYNAGYRKLAQASNSPEIPVSEGNPNKNTDGVRKLIEGLARGDCKGVKGATVYKIQQYAEETGLI